MPKKSNAYSAGTVHVAKEVHTIQTYILEPYMSEKRVKPESATVHVAKCFPMKMIYNFDILAREFMIVRIVLVLVSEESK